MAEKWFFERLTPHRIGDKVFRLQRGPYRRGRMRLFLRRMVGKLR